MTVSKAPQFEAEFETSELNTLPDYSEIFKNLPLGKRLAARFTYWNLSFPLMVTSLVAAVPTTFISANVFIFSPFLGALLNLPAVVAITSMSVHFAGSEFTENQRALLSSPSSKSQQLSRNFSSWLKTIYGLRLDPKSLAVNWTGLKDEQELSLLTDDGSRIHGRIVRTGDQNFELRKLTVADTTESPYFTELSALPAAPVFPALTAQRSSPHELTAERS